MGPDYGSQVASPVLSGSLDQKELRLCDVTIIHPREVNSTQTVAIFKLSRPIFRFTMEARHVERFTVKFTHLAEYTRQRMRHYREIELPALASGYVIRSPEAPHTILSHLGGEIIRYFSQHKGWFLEGAEDLLLVYWRGKKVKPEHLGGFLQDCGRIATLFDKTSAH